MIILIYSILFLSLTVYSYTQIDLNLTLSSNPLYQTIQNQLIQIGYFNRPLSAGIYIILLLLFVICYLLFLRLIRAGRYAKQQLIIIIGLSVGILLFSYSAFSHDLFNYMFDARMVTKYGVNPYNYKALDFPLDPWIRFMHWTHRTYPYGQVWLLLTLPLSYLGFGKFVVTLFNFKLLFALTHLGNVWLISKILEKTDKKNALSGVAFYALNPLILIESLISPHLDAIMLFFLLAALYFILVKKNYWGSMMMVVISGLIKFVTLALIPVFLFIGKRAGTSDKIKKLFIFLNLFVFLIILLIPIREREPYPWYFIPVIGIGALLVSYHWIRIILIGLSLGLLLRYAPYLYVGDYPPFVAQWENILLFIPLGISVVFIIVRNRLSIKRTNEL